MSRRDILQLARLIFGIMYIDRPFKGVLNFNPIKKNQEEKEKAMQAFILFYFFKGNISIEFSDHYVQVAKETK